MNRSIITALMNEIPRKKKLRNNNRYNSNERNRRDYDKSEPLYFQKRSKNRSPPVDNNNRDLLDQKGFNKNMNIYQNDKVVKKMRNLTGYRQSEIDYLNSKEIKRPKKFKQPEINDILNKIDNTLITQANTINYIPFDKHQQEYNDKVTEMTNHRKNSQLSQIAEEDDQLAQTGMKMRRYEYTNNNSSNINLSPLSNKKIMEAQKKIHEKLQYDRDDAKRTKNNSFFSKNNKEWMDNRIEKELALSQRERSNRSNTIRNSPRDAEWFDENDNVVLIPDIMVENRLEFGQQLQSSLHPLPRQQINKNKSISNLKDSERFNLDQDIFQNKTIDHNDIFKIQQIAQQIPINKSQSYQNKNYRNQGFRQSDPKTMELVKSQEYYKRIMEEQKQTRNLSALYRQDLFDSSTDKVKEQIIKHNVRLPKIMPLMQYDNDGQEGRSLISENSDRRQGLSTKEIQKRNLRKFIEFQPKNLEYQNNPSLLSPHPLDVSVFKTSRSPQLNDPLSGRGRNMKFEKLLKSYDFETMKSYGSLTPTKIQVLEQSRKMNNKTTTINSSMPSPINALGPSFISIPIQPYEVRARLDPKIQMIREYDERTFGTNSGFVSIENHMLDRNINLNEIIDPILKKPTDYSVLRTSKFDRKHIQNVHKIILKQQKFKSARQNLLYINKDLGGQ